IPPSMNPKLLAGLTRASQSRSSRSPSRTSTPSAPSKWAASARATSGFRSLSETRREVATHWPNGLRVRDRIRRILPASERNIQRPSRVGGASGGFGITRSRSRHPREPACPGQPLIRLCAWLAPVHRVLNVLLDVGQDLAVAKAAVLIEPGEDGFG